MTSKQSSVGRELELLLRWWIPVGDRIPTGSRRLQHLADKLSDAITEAQAMVRVALKTSDCNVRLEALEGAILSFEEFKSIMDDLCEYCEHSPNLHFISKSQKSTYLRQAESIGRQLGGWERKTKRLVEQEQAEQKRLEEERQREELKAIAKDIQLSEAGRRSHGETR